MPDDKTAVGFHLQQKVCFFSVWNFPQHHWGHKQNLYWCKSCCATANTNECLGRFKASRMENDLYDRAGKLWPETMKCGQTVDSLNVCTVSILCQHQGIRSSTKQNKARHKSLDPLVLADKVRIKRTAAALTQYQWGLQMKSLCGSTYLSMSSSFYLMQYYILHKAQQQHRWDSEPTFIPDTMALIPSLPVSSIKDSLCHLLLFPVLFTQCFKWPLLCSFHLWSVRVNSQIWSISEWQHSFLIKQWATYFWVT